MQGKPKRGKDTDKALALMFEVGRVIRHACITKETLPLPFSYIETLRFVEEHKNPSMRDIAQYLRVAAPSATAVVEALVGEGYLSRKEDAVDRRLVRLHVSAKGKRVLETTNRARMEALRTVLGSLNGTDRKELIRIFSKIVKN
ncbi:MarR family transcriptional regulator [Candidatus Kaiserbacteria bacterium]|nr:MarR family transcriptional regulator [Candidatus Kaiserbacteria bacterium]